MHQDKNHQSQVSKLATVLQKKLLINQYDVEPHYIPELNQAVGLIKLAISAIPTDEDGWLWQEHTVLFAQRPAIKKQFLYMLNYVKRTLTENKCKFTFWHVAAMVMLTSFSYANRLQAGKHKTVNLADEKTLQSMEPDVCVLLLNHLSNRIFQSPLTVLHNVISTEQFDVSVFFTFFQQQIARCNQ